MAVREHLPPVAGEVPDIEPSQETAQEFEFDNPEEYSYDDSRDISPPTRGRLSPGKRSPKSPIEVPERNMGIGAYRDTSMISNWSAYKWDAHQNFKGVKKSFGGVAKPPAGSVNGSGHKNGTLLPPTARDPARDVASQGLERSVWTRLYPQNPYQPFLAVEGPRKLADSPYAASPGSSPTRTQSAHPRSRQASRSPDKDMRPKSAAHLDESPRASAEYVDGEPAQRSRANGVATARDRHYHADSAYKPWKKHKVGPVKIPNTAREPTRADDWLPSIQAAYVRPPLWVASSYAAPSSRPPSEDRSSHKKGSGAATVYTEKQYTPSLSPALPYITNHEDLPEYRPEWQEHVLAPEDFRLDPRRVELSKSLGRSPTRNCGLVDRRLDPRGRGAAPGPLPGPHRSAPDLPAALSYPINVPVHIKPRPHSSRVMEQRQHTMVTGDPAPRMKKQKSTPLMHSKEELRRGTSPHPPIPPHLRAQYKEAQRQRAAAEQALREELAATQIQAAHRGHITRQQVGHMRQEQTAALRIQSVQRGRVARKSVLEERRQLATEHSRSETAATRIQAVQRGRVARRHVAEERQRSTQAAVKIQAAQRGRSSRLQLQQQKQSAAATKIQAAQRGRTERKSVAVIKMYGHESGKAASRIQAVHRGRSSRKQVEQMKQERREKQDAATRIQAVHRGRTARRQSAMARDLGVNYHDMNAAATRIQAAHRGRTARRSVAKDHKDIGGGWDNRSAATSQRDAVDERKQRSAAAVRIQAAQRGQMARKRVDATDEHKARLEKARRRRAEEKRQRQLAAARIQARIRGIRDRQMVAELKEQKKAAIKIQANVRRMNVQRELKQAHEAATKIQRAFRAYMAHKAEVQAAAASGTPVKREKPLGKRASIMAQVTMQASRVEKMRNPSRFVPAMSDLKKRQSVVTIPPLPKPKEKKPKKKKIIFDEDDEDDLKAARARITKTKEIEARGPESTRLGDKRGQAARQRKSIMIRERANMVYNEALSF